MDRKSLAVALAVGGIVLAASPSGWTKTLPEFRTKDHQTFEVGSSPDIDVSNVCGDISYTAVAGTTVTVDVTLIVSAETEEEAAQIRDEIKLRIKGGSGSLFAEVKFPDDLGRLLRRKFGKDRDVCVQFEITGPHDAMGSLESVSGNVSLSGTTGMMEIASVSGDVELEDCSGHLTATSVSGNTRVTSCKGPIEASSVSGNVQVKRSSGTLTADGVSGNVVVESHNGGFTVETVSGDISVRAHSGQEDMSVETISGQVTIAVDPSELSEVQLETMSGEIETTNLPFAFKGRRSDGSMKLRVGKGDAILKVSTLSGDIQLASLVE